MKDLPEHEAFKALEHRLNNYTEEPDDDHWQKIAAALPPRQPLWAPWLNRLAGTLAIAALGWALWYRPAVGGDALAIAHPKSATIEDVAGGSEIHHENEGSKGALSPAGQQDRNVDAMRVDKKSALANRGTGSTLSSEGSSVDSDATDLRVSNQHATSTRIVSHDLNRNTVSRSTARQDSCSASASANATSNGNRHADLHFGQTAPAHGTTDSPAFAEISKQGVDLKQESSLDNVSPDNATAINPTDESRYTTALPTQDSHFETIVIDSSQHQKVVTMESTAEATGASGETTSYSRPKKKRAGISFYVLFSPTLSFQTATPSARDGIVIQKINKPSLFSGDRLGLAFEAGVQGRLSKKVEYFGGLSVYHQSQTLRYTYQSSGNFVMDNGGDDLSYTVKPTAVERSISYSMLNIGAQAGVLYTLKEHRLSHKIGLALHYQKGLTQGSAGEPYDNASSTYLNYQVLYRAEIMLDSHLTFIVQPSITRTWLVNETLLAPFALKQYRPGISVGLSYRWTR
jgi:hypothetical protein